MEQDVIKENFGKINPANREPLYLQIRRHAEVYIEKQPDNTLFPSERELATVLNINRQTIRRALEPFKAMLKRDTRGTVINKNQDSVEAELDSLHPLLFEGDETVDMAVKDSLNILLMENLPAQIEFWKDVAAEYSLLEGDITVNVEWLDKSVGSMSDYEVLLKGTDYDLIQIPSIHTWSEELGRILKRNSDDYIQKLNSDAYFFQKFCQFSPEIINNTFPVYFSLPVLYFNKKFLKGPLKNLPEEMVSQSYNDVLNKIVSELSESSYIASHTGDVHSILSLPWPLKNEDAIKNYVYQAMKAIDIIARARKHNQCFSMPINSIYDLKQQKLDFFAGNVLMISSHLALHSFLLGRNVEPEICFIPTPAGLPRTAGVISLAATASGKPAEILEKFSLFLLSEKIQNQLATTIHGAPFLKTSVFALQNALPGNVKAIMEMLSNTIVLPKERISYMTERPLHTFFTKIFKREMTLDRAFNLWCDNYL